MDVLQNLFAKSQKAQKIPIKELAIRIKALQDLSSHLKHEGKPKEEQLGVWQIPTRKSLGDTLTKGRTSVHNRKRVDVQVVEDDQKKFARSTSWKSNNNKLQLIENMELAESGENEDRIEVITIEAPSSASFVEQSEISISAKSDSGSPLLGSSPLQQGFEDSFPPDIALHRLIEMNNFEKFVAVFEPYFEKNGEHAWTSAVDPAAGKCTLLHKAARCNNIPFMNFLIEKGHPVDLPDAVEATPLFYAVVKNHPRACTTLLTKGASTNVRDVYENSPFLLSMKHGHLPVANTLLLFGADMNFKGKRGNTPMHLACEEGKLDRVKFLLEAAGASPMILSSLNRNNETPLYLCLKEPEIVEYLLKFMQDNFDSAKCLKTIQQTNANGLSVFHRCADAGWMKSFLLFITSLPDKTLEDLLNLKEKVMGNTPLQIAVLSKRLEMVKFLTTAEEVNVDIQNNKGDTALHLAIRQKNVVLARLLVEANASQKIKNNEGQTTKELATKLGINMSELVAASNTKRKGSTLVREEAIKAAVRKSWKENIKVIEGKRLELESEKEYSIENNEGEATVLLDPQLVKFGLPEIDDHNMELVQMTNELHKNMLGQTDKSITASIIGSLIDFTERAFKIEETLFKKHNVGLMYITRHIDMHEDFKDRLKEIQTQFIKGESLVEVTLLGLLTDWVREHISVVDKTMVEKIKRKKRASVSHNEDLVQHNDNAQPI